MTLLELLVKELPGRGGWPEGASHAGYTRTWGGVSFTRGGAPAFNGDDLSIFTFHGADEKAFWMSGSGFDCDKPVDYATAIITRGQYEAAIAAQQPVWDGEGLPPIGCDVEFTLDKDKYSAQGNIPENGQVVNVVAHKQTTDGNPVAVVYWDARGAGRAAAFIKAAFSPIRTEADRKRDEAIKSMYEVVSESGYDTPEPVSIYDAIAAGKIPGVEITK